MHLFYTLQSWEHDVSDLGKPGPAGLDRGGGQFAWEKCVRIEALRVQKPKWPLTAARLQRTNFVLVPILKRGMKSWSPNQTLRKIMHTILTLLATSYEMKI